MDNFSVALTKNRCFYCGKQFDGSIVINSVLTEEAAQEVSKLHGKCIGYSDEICQECKDLVKDNLAIFEIDENKSTPENPFRTGKSWIIEKDCNFAKYLQENNFIINNFGFNFAFIAEECAKEVGFYD